MLVPSHQRHAKVVIGAHTGQVNYLEYSPTGKATSQLVSTITDQLIRSYDAKTGELLGCYVGHTGSIYSAKFDVTGGLLASVSDDYTICIWDSTTYVMMIWSPPSSLSATTAPNHLGLSSRFKLTCSIDCISEVLACMFSHDSLYLVFRLAEGQAAILHLSSGEVRLSAYLFCLF